jgi:glycosyltransferase involved in cell wall biosynthesis
LLHRRLGLESRFRFLGFRADAVDLLAASDVFCLPSHHEGLPVAIMEATTLGLPVVATAVGGIPEVLKNGVSALLVPAHDPNALAGALISVCSNASLRNKLGSGAFSVSAAFDARRSVERLAAIYRSFANRHRTGFANG